MIARLYKHFRWLSLDVSSGAVVLSLILAIELGVPVSSLEAVCLGLAVFVIYNMDHLRDARRPLAETDERRNFHLVFFRPILSATIGATIIGLMCVWQLRAPVVYAGIILVSAVGLYVVLCDYLRSTKEVLAAILFTAGVLIVPLTEKGFTNQVMIVFVLLFSIALTNLILFSKIESTADHKLSFDSVVQRSSRVTINYILITLFSLSGVISIITMQFTLYFGVYSCFVNLIYLLIWRMEWFHSHERYRIFGDGMFLLPIILLI